MPPSDDETVEAFVERIIRRQTGFKGTLTDATELYYDLSLAGDDTAEVFEAVSGRFGTSWAGMRFQDYFPDEPTALFYHIARLLGFRRKKSCTMGHLLNVIRRGQWFEPPSACEPG